MKKTKIIILMFIIICVFSTNIIKVESSSLIQDIISEGNSFTNAGQDNGLGSSLAGFINGDIKDVVSLVGNLVFAGITVILGAKYIWSGVSGKSQVKETLPSFITAVMFFYLAVEITGIFSPKSAGSLGSGLNSIKDYDSLAKLIIGTINLVVKYLALGGIIFIGLKYMFASADGKAQIKDKLAPMALGIVLVFSASTIVDFIIQAGWQTLQ